MASNQDGSSGHLLIGILLCSLWLVMRKLEYLIFSWMADPKYQVLLASLVALFFLVSLGLLLARIGQHHTAKALEESILAQTSDSVACGLSSDRKEVHIKTKQRIMHTQIVGTTNAGKTESVILPWAIQDMKQGRGLLLIDGKSDKDLLDKLYSYACKYGRQNDFRLFSLSNISKSQTFNPLTDGTADEITERLFSAFTFENQFYRSLQYEVLSQVLRIFEYSNEIPTFLKLHQGITNYKHLERLLDASDAIPLKQWLGQFKNLSSTERDQRTSGLTSQLSPFAFGKTAALYNSTSPDINIEEALKQNHIVYFQLPVLLAPFLGSATGKLVLQSLQSAIANRHRGPKDERKFFSVFLDDFSEYLYPGFVSVLNKSRSANVGVVFAHQALGDIEALGESVSNAILTNSNVKVFMRGNDPKSAEHFSKIIGTKQATKTTERRKISLLGNQGTGDVSSREVEEFVVHPNCFKKDLGVGEAIMIIPHDRGSKSLRIKFDRFPDLTSCPLPDSIPGTPEGFEILDDPLTELPSNKKRELT